MEGHQFGIFCIKMTSDNRYIVSVSNKFITFDVVTSDLSSVQAGLTPPKGAHDRP